MTHVDWSGAERWYERDGERERENERKFIREK